MKILAATCPFTPQSVKRPTQVVNQARLNFLVQLSSMSSRVGREKSLTKGTYSEAEGGLVSNTLSNGIGPGWTVTVSTSHVYYRVGERGRQKILSKPRCSLDSILPFLYSSRHYYKRLYLSSTLVIYCFRGIF